MTTIKIELTGLDGTINGLSSAPKVIEEEVTFLVNQAVLGGSDIAKGLVGKKTHHLERSITALPGTWAGGTITAAWGTNVPYARMHEEGTAAHFITPRKAKVLAFTVSGKKVFARRVFHPGTKPKLYMKGSYDRVAQRLPANAEKTKARIIQRISQGGA